MRYALVNAGMIDAISFEPQEAPWIEVPDDVFAGFVQDGNGWAAPPAPPAPVPPSISFAQLLIGLVSEGWITADEGRAWRDRTALPAPVQALIASLPEAQQFAAETRAFAPSEVLRNDPLVQGLGVVAGKTEAQLDDFFRTYSGV